MSGEVDHSYFARKDNDRGVSLGVSFENHIDNASAIQHVESSVGFPCAMFQNIS